MQKKEYIQAIGAQDVILFDFNWLFTLSGKGYRISDSELSKLMHTCNYLTGEKELLNRIELVS